jgi:hypothetical protein
MPAVFCVLGGGSAGGGVSAVSSALRCGSPAADAAAATSVQATGAAGLHAVSPAARVSACAALPPGTGVPAVATVLCAALVRPGGDSYQQGPSVPLQPPVAQGSNATLKNKRKKKKNVASASAQVVPPPPMLIVQPQIPLVPGLIPPSGGLGIAAGSFALVQSGPVGQAPAVPEVPEVAPVKPGKC